MLYALHINNSGLRESIEFYIKNILSEEVIRIDQSIEELYKRADKTGILIIDSTFPGNKHIELLISIKKNLKNIKTYLLMSNMEKNIYEEMYKNYVDKFICESNIYNELSK